MDAKLVFQKLNMDVTSLLSDSAEIGEGSSTQEIEDVMKKLEHASRALGQPQEGDDGNEMVQPNGDTEMSLADAAKDGFDLRLGRVAQLWKSELAHATSEWKLAYKACKGWEAKAAFRKEWAARKLKEIQVSRTHSSKFSRVDTKKGEYYNFGLLVETFGVHYDKDKAILLAVKHAQKALVLGPPWIQHDAMADVTEYLKLKTQFKEEFDEAWELKEKEYEHSELPTATKEPSSAAAAPPSQATAKRSAETLAIENEGQRGAAAKGAGRAGPASQPSGRVPSPPAGAKKARPAHNELNELVGQVSKVKTQYSNVMSQCQNLIQTIEAQQSWSWARTPEGLDDLKILLESIVIAPGLETFILNDIKDVKSSMTPEMLMTMAVQFVQLKPQLEQVEGRCNQLLKAHALMQKAA